MGERRSSPRACPVLDTGVNNVSGRGARREAASLRLGRRQAHVEAAARLRVSHAAEHEESVGATDLSATGRRTPTSLLRTKRGVRFVPDVKRKERSTPTARPVSSDGGDQLPTTGRVSSGRRAYHSNRRTGPRTKDQRQLRRLCPRCLLRRARSSPLRQHSLVGNRGRANHPPVMPVRQGSRTQVSMVGNLGESQTAHSLSPGPAPR